MAMDGLMVYALTQELSMLQGARINKIHQPTADEIVMHIRTGGTSVKLLLSANPTYPRLHLTKASYQNPLDAPMFCMLLRKYCEGGIIEQVSQVGIERILKLDVKHRDELGDLSIRSIIVEIMGRHSNIILLDPATDVILDGIRHVTPAISSHRVVLPGSTYIAPPKQDKINPLTATSDEIEAIIRERFASDESQDSNTLTKWLVQTFAGLSPLSAREIVYRCNRQPADRHHLVQAFLAWLDQIHKHEVKPTITIEDSSGKEFFSLFPLTHINGVSTQYDTISECVEAFYVDKAERDRVKQRTQDLIRFLQNEKNKCIRKLDKLKKTLQKASHAEHFRIMGELLTANLHAINKGDSEVELMNYYDEEQKPLRIPLDPQRTPSENAQHYFKKYTKSKNSVVAMKEQIEATKQEIEYVDNVLQQLENASLHDIEQIRDELVAEGYIRQRQKHSRRKKKPNRPLLTCYTSSEGIEIYVGKNNTQNEYLTNKLAHSTDTWLHTKDIPGSHVVIRAKQFGDHTLEEAAMLSAYYSRAKASSQVPVDYTYIRHVRKPNGAKPGFVIYDHQKTIYITPDEQRIKKLKVTLK